MAEPDADGQGDHERDADRGGRQLELLDRLVPDQAGVVLDEPERVAEDEMSAITTRPRPRPRREHALCEHEQRIGDERQRRPRARPSTMSSVLKNWRSARKIGRPRPCGITKAATVASAIVDTVAMRTPAMIAGQRERQLDPPQDLRRAHSHARARPRARRAGTERNPVRMFRNRIRSVYETRATSTVVTVSPVTGTSSWKKREARDRVDESGDEVERALEPRAGAGRRAPPRTRSRSRRRPR